MVGGDEGLEGEVTKWMNDAMVEWGVNGCIDHGCVGTGNMITAGDRLWEDGSWWVVGSYVMVVG